MDISKIVNKIVASGVEEADAEKQVKNVIAKLEESGKIEGLSEARIVEIVTIAASKRFVKVTGDEFIGVCVGYSGMEDDNGYAKWLILQDYNNDKMNAVTRGIVTMSDDVDSEGNKTPIPMDTRKYLDNARTKINPNYGEPYPTKLIRKVLFVIDGQLYTAKFNNDKIPTIGASYKLICKINGKYMNYVERMDIDEILSASEMWDFITDVGGEFDEFREIEDIDYTDKNKIVIMTATISRAGCSNKGCNYVVFESAFMGDGIVGFYAEPRLVEAVSNSAEEGKVVVLLAKVGLSKDGMPLFNIYGMFHDPDTDNSSSIISDIESMFGDME